jgi:hypothetical protein
MWYDSLRETDDGRFSSILVKNHMNKSDKHNFTVKDDSSGVKRINIKDKFK